MTHNNLEAPYDNWSPRPSEIIDDIFSKFFGIFLFFLSFNLYWLCVFLNNSILIEFTLNNGFLSLFMSIICFLSFYWIGKIAWENLEKNDWNYWNIFGFWICAGLFFLGWIFLNFSGLLNIFFFPFSSVPSAEVISSEIENWASGIQKQFIFLPYVNPNSSDLIFIILKTSLMLSLGISLILVALYFFIYFKWLKIIFAIYSQLNHAVNMKFRNKFELNIWREEIGLKIFPNQTFLVYLEINTYEGISISEILGISDEFFMSDKFSLEKVSEQRFPLNLKENETQRLTYSLKTSIYGDLRYRLRIKGHNSELKKYNRYYRFLLKIFLIKNPYYDSETFEINVYPFEPKLTIEYSTLVSRTVEVSFKILNSGEGTAKNIEIYHKNNNIEIIKAIAPIISLKPTELVHRSIIFQPNIEKKYLIPFKISYTDIQGNKSSFSIFELDFDYNLPLKEVKHSKTVIREIYLEKKESISQKDFYQDSYSVDEDFMKKIIKSKEEGHFWDFKRELNISGHKNKGDFIRDMISLGNRALKDKKKAFLIVGVNEADSSLVTPFLEDEAKYQQIISSYVDPLINFEIRRPTIFKTQIAVFVILGKGKRPFSVKKELRGPYQKIELSIGDSWIRAGSLNRKLNHEELKKLAEELASQIY